MENACYFFFNIRRKESTDKKKTNRHFNMNITFCHDLIYAMTSYKSHNNKSHCIKYMIKNKTNIFWGHIQHVMADLNAVIVAFFSLVTIYSMT